MTAKQKAKELVKKCAKEFGHHEPIEGLKGGDMAVWQQLSKMVCDEIIELRKRDDEDYNFWEKVKQEIDKL